MEFSPTLLAIVPPLLAILLAVITRQVVLSLFIAVFVGAVFVGLAAIAGPRKR